MARPELRVLLTSGYALDPLAANGHVRDGTLILEKPYRRAELARLLRGGALRAAAELKIPGRQPPAGGRVDRASWSEAEPANPIPDDVIPIDVGHVDREWLPIGGVPVVVTGVASSLAWRRLQ
jgi:hypothetical protein